MNVELIVLAVVVVLLVFGGRMLVSVRGSEVGIRERRYLGRSLPEARVVAMRGEIGFQARSLKPGLYVLPPFLYKVSREEMIVVQDEQVGLVESIDGLPLQPGQIFARHVASHGNFQDGEAFLHNGGQKGPQVDVLPPGKYRINSYLFHVRLVPVTTIPPGHVGVASARDGSVIQAGRLLAQKAEGHNSFQDGETFLKNGGQRGPQIEVILPGRYRINTDLFQIEVKEATVIEANQVGLVTANDGQPLPSGDLVAPHVEHHNDFQDAPAFLASRGLRGPQFDLLKPGTYYVNPLMFNVKLDEVMVVNRGEVAVLVSNVGGEPDWLTTEDRLRSGQERYVVPAGCRGIQVEVAGPGAYYLNRWAYIPYIIPTTNITIDWAEQGGGEEVAGVTLSKSGLSALPQVFDELTVISRDGFEMQVSVKVIIRIRPDQAPLMVSKIGSLHNLVEHVVHPMIDSCFRNQASSTEAMRFMQDRTLEQHKIEKQARTELEKYHVEIVSVLISQIVLPQNLMEIQTKRVIATQQQEMYVEQQRAEEKRIATDNTRATADKQPDLVAAQVGVQIAEQTRQQTIIRAEGEARAIEMLGQASGKKVLAVGSATAEAFQKQVAAVGQLNLTAIEVAKSIAAAGLKITPDILVGAGAADGSSGIFSAFLAQLLTGKDVGHPLAASGPAAENR
ncbi:MAG: hypothetical protein JJE04_20805 [Acidobacteriia bacterium]|nr:hypothetical protein [Terriglobia bacterium]